MPLTYVSAERQILDKGRVGRGSLACCVQRKQVLESPQLAQPSRNTYVALLFDMSLQSQGRAIVN